MADAPSLSLALVDFLPSLFFFTGSIFIVRLAYRMRGKNCGLLALAGTFMVFMGGFFKAAGKLIYALNGTDVVFFNQGQFVWLGLGFLGLLLAAILLARRTRAAASGTVVMPAFAAAMALWKMPFLFLMTLASLGVNGIFAYLSFRRKLYWAAAGFVVAFLCLLAMGGMASAEQTLPQQWIEEITNSLGNLGFMLGGIVLDRKFGSL